MTQQDYNFHGPDGTIQPYQPIVGSMDGASNPYPPGGFVGGFTPNYSPPPSTFQPAFPFPQPSPAPSPYDGFPSPSMDESQPPPLPTMPPSFSYRQPQNYHATQNVDMDSNVSPLASSSHLQSISSMSAQERSRNLRIPKTKPHLEFMVGPLLRYDTIENGVWRGAVLIVSECACSRMCFYSPFVLNCGIPYPDPPFPRSFGRWLILRPATHVQILL